MAVKSDNSALIVAIAKANKHPDPEGFASTVLDIMAGKEPVEEPAAEPVAEEGTANA